MKTALLLISNSPDPQTYLKACTDKVISEGYILLTPSDYEAYARITTMEYIERVMPIIDTVFLFVDFHETRIMADVKKMHSVRYRVFKNPERFTHDSITLEGILMQVSKKAVIDYDVLTSKTRKREIVEARQIYFKRARQSTRFSLAAIGALVGQDHATILHGIKQVDNIKYLTVRYDFYFNGGPDPDRKIKKPIEIEKEFQPIKRDEFSIPRYQNKYANTPVRSGMYMGYKAVV